MADLTNPSSGSFRAFIALPIPEPERAALERIQDELRDTNAEMKWVKPENFHITLFFLGNVAQGQAEEIRASLSETCRAREPFPVTLHGVGAFPNLRRPNTVWAGFAGDVAPLKALAEEVSRAMEDLGFERDKPFKPHLTLGRARSDRGARALTVVLQRLKDSPIGSFTADSVVLYQSDLRPQGPIYTPLDTVPLSGAKSVP